MTLCHILLERRGWVNSTTKRHLVSYPQHPSVVDERLEYAYWMLFKEVRNPSKRGVHVITQNCIWWFSFSPTDLESINNLTILLLLPGPLVVIVRVPTVSNKISLKFICIRWDFVQNKSLISINKAKKKKKGNMDVQLVRFSNL